MEEWHPVPNYEGLYEVSNRGRVRSLYRYKKVLKPSIVTGGYLSVELWKNKHSKRILVHRLVAIAFIDNPNNKPCVNHKDEVKTNNNVENLEWMTHAENCNYGTAIARRLSHTDYSKMVRHTENQIKACSKPVTQYTKDGKYVKSWPSASECHRKTGIAISGIRRAAKGEVKTAGGYVFREG